MDTKTALNQHFLKVGDAASRGRPDSGSALRSIDDLWPGYFTLCVIRLFGFTPKRDKLRRVVPTGG